MTNSATRTSFRLRIYNNNSSGGVSAISTKTWPTDPALQGIYKGHSVCVSEPVSTGGGDPITYIYITGEGPVAGHGQNIYVLRYAWTHDAGNTVTGPLVRTWPNVPPYTDFGDDIGWKIARFTAGNGQGYVVVTGQSQGNGTGLDSITLGYIEDVNNWPTNPTWAARYTGVADDVTWAVCDGPISNDEVTVVVAGYSDNGATDDFLVRSLRVTDGQIQNDWTYDAGADERANGVASDGVSRVFAAGWTMASVLPIDLGKAPDGPDGPDSLNPPPNYLAARFDLGDSAKVWAALYNGSGNSSDIGYDTAFSPQYDRSSPNEVHVPERLPVAGASTGAGSGFDFKVLMLQTNTGANDWGDGQPGVPGRWDNTLHGDDEPFVLGVDVAPGHVYCGGRSWRTNGGVNSMDMATVKFDRLTGACDNGGSAHKFRRFFADGGAHSSDSVLSLNANHDGEVDVNTKDELPVIFVTGFTVESGQQENIRTIKYRDPGRIPLR